MLLRCLKKMYKNKWIYTALTLGLMLSIITVIVLPMFARSSQDRLVRQTLDDSKKSTKIYPLCIDYNYKNAKASEEKVTDEFMKKVDGLSETNTEKLKLPIINSKKILYTQKFLFWDSSKDVLKNPREITEYNLASINDLEKNITILKGRMPKVSSDDKGIQEVIVHKNIYNPSSLDLEKVYETTLDQEPAQIIETLNEPDYKSVKFKIVGVYDIKESDFWSKGIWDPGQYYFLTNIDCHMQILKVMPNRYSYINEYYLDYNKLKYSQVDKKSKNNLIKTFKEIQTSIKKSNGTVSWGLEDVIKKMESKMTSTVKMMIIILLPLIFMLIVYILMISTIIANNDNNEISLLKSRGAKLYQIFTPYIIKGIIMGIISIIIAPLIAKCIVTVMGTTTGFLTFGNETDLISYIKSGDYILTLVVIIFFIFAMLIPVYITSRKTIVELKREKFRVTRTSLWKKYGLDIIILGFSTYCFYNFIIKEFAETKGSMAQDPSMYLIISGMCLGISLVFLRIYPFIISFIFKLAKKLWKPETYYILLYSARNSVKKEQIMIFLIFTLSIGIFNMNSARKMNREGENNISYKTGADITLLQLLEQDETAFDKDYKKYADIPGVKNTAKVLTKPQIKMMSDKKDVIGRLVAINPYDFGKVAWMRDDLFPTHWNNYLNALTLEPGSILISNSLVKQGFRVGDKVKMLVPLADELPTDQEISYYVEYKIVGSFNFWPGWNSTEKGHEFLVVGNYDYLIENTSLMKYEVWLSTEDGKKSDEIRESLIKEDMTPQVFKSTDKEIEKFKKDIFIQTVNGTYTFAFIMTMIITFTGFMVYWTLSMKERELQFGIIRALGISKKRVSKMIFIEQIIFSVVPLGIGTLIGTKMFEIFAPITNEQNIQGKINLPILVQYIASDYIKILCILAIMTVIILLSLIAYISKLKINQAVKLGED